MDNISSENGVSEIFKAIYKLDALSIVSYVFNEFLSTLSTRHEASESFKTF